MGTGWGRAVGSAGSPPCSSTVSPAVGERSAGMILWGLFQGWGRFSIDVHPAHVYSTSYPHLVTTCSRSSPHPFPSRCLFGVHTWKPEF